MRKKYAILLLTVLFSSCEKVQDDSDILKFYGDAYEDVGYSIAKADNGYVIAGLFTEIIRSENRIITGSSRKMGIIKTGYDGNMIWKKSFGDLLPAVGTKVLVLEDGSVICTGYITDQEKLQKDIFIVKTNADGTNPMQKIYPMDGNQYGIDIVKTREGFLILGTTDVERLPATDSTGNTAGKKDILLLRINNNLEQIVLPTPVGYPGNDEGAAIKSDINGGYIVVGTTDRSIPKHGQDKNNILLLKVNEDGSSIQNRILGGTEDEYAADIEVLSNGYLIVGRVGSDASDQSVYLSKIQGSIFADPVFTNIIKINKSFPNFSSSTVNAICGYKTNSFLLAGQAGTGSSAKMLIFVADSDGNLVEGKQRVTGGTGIQVAFDVISDENDNIIVIGKNSYDNNSMISLLKFRF